MGKNFNSEIIFSRASCSSLLSHTRFHTQNTPTMLTSSPLTSVSGVFRQRTTGLTQRRFASSSNALKMQSKITSQNKRSRTTIVVPIKAMADDDEFEMPDFVKDLMKPPDASVAAPVWLAPLLGIVEESGD